MFHTNVCHILCINKGTPVRNASKNLMPLLPRKPNGALVEMYGVFGGEHHPAHTLVQGWDYSISHVFVITRVPASRPAALAWSSLGSE